MERSLSAKLIAPRILRALAAAQLAAPRHALTLDTLVRELELPRADVRRVVSDLHREGHLDALRMRLTASGFALGLALARVEPRQRALPFTLRVVAA